MAQDPPDPKTPRPKQPSSRPLTSPPVSPRAGRAPVPPVPFEASFAGGAKDGGRGDLSDEDLRDITELLGQQQDVTRQDIPAQDFQALLDRYAKKID